MKSKITLSTLLISSVLISKPVSADPITIGGLALGLGQVLWDSVGKPSIEAIGRRIHHSLSQKVQHQEIEPIHILIRGNGDVDAALPGQCLEHAPKLMLSHSTESEFGPGGERSLKSRLTIYVDYTSSLIEGDPEDMKVASTPGFFKRLMNRMTGKSKGAYDRLDSSDDENRHYDASRVVTSRYREEHQRLLDDEDDVA